MSHSKEFRRQQNLSAFNEEVQWFAKAFRQPETRRDLSSELKAMIWENPADNILPSYSKSLSV